MLTKTHKKRLSALTKTAVMVRLIDAPHTLEEMFDGMSAYQMQDLRDYLQNQILYLSGQSATPLTREQISERLEPIPNYYHKQYCREPLEACFNETCLSSNPSCFSKKMRTQISVLVRILLLYLQEDNKKQTVN